MRKRILSLLAVALVMAAGLVILAVPAFAVEGSDCATSISGGAKQGGVGAVVSGYATYAGRDWGFAIEDLCNPTD